MSEGKVMIYDDGVELVIDRKGKRIFVDQHVLHLNIDGSEQAEEWHAASGRIVLTAELFN